MRLPEPFHPVGPAHAGMVRSIRARGSGPLGRPRARGDGSGVGTSADGNGLSAPRTRGWFRAGRDTPGPGGVGPAHAGMVPVFLADLAPDISRPRARGDGSQRDCTGVRTFPSAPRTRGWFGDRLPVRGGRDVGPAHAGMVPRTGPRRGRSRCRPRARGDGSVEHVEYVEHARSAPRTRGWFPEHVKGATWATVGPAHAGMVRAVQHLDPAGLGRPRARGDGSSSGCSAARRRRSAPRTRGWFPSALVRRQCGGVGPAHAGMVPRRPSPRRRSRSRPRARGDGSST